MTGELTENSSDSGAGDGCMSLLKTLGHEEILEVLSEGLCRRCQPLLEARIHRILNRRGSERPKWNDSNEGSESFHRRPHKRMRPLQSFPRTPEPSYSSRRKRLVTDNRNSFEHSDFKIVSSGFDNGLFEEKKEQIRISPQASRKKDFEYIERIDGRQRRFTSNSSRSSGFEMLLNDGPSRVSSGVDSELSEERKELIRMSQIIRKKDFAHIERINQKPINVLQGLELHTNVFNTEEQKNIVDYVYKLQRMGQRRELRERTYSEPKKWMRGKGRVTIQFGCCYNYAKDRNGNPPGIIRDEEVDPIPPLFKKVIKRMVRWQVLPPTCIPDSCIVNIYEEGDCIPPHIDHHDFVRPFYTLSFLSECNIVFGSTLEVVGPGEFSGPVSIPLPVGSVFILNGNGADIAKHCIPGVPAKRISITFRKMDESKLPYRFFPDPELVGIKPLMCSPLKNTSLIEKDDSPPQDSLNAPNRLRVSEGRSNRSNRRLF